MPIPPDAPPAQLDLSEAFRIAVQVHGDQRDKAGLPYMGHVIRVMNLMDNDTERAVAILHDTIEDAPEQIRNDLLRCIYRTYGAVVAAAVMALTQKAVRLRNATYQIYISELSRNPLATKVKMADLLDNGNPTRLAKLPAQERWRLETKYSIAMDTLRMAEYERFNKGETYETHSNSAGTGAVQLPSRTDPAAYPEHFLKALAGGSGISRDPFAEANTVIAAGSYPNRTPEGKAGEPATESVPAPTATDATRS